MRALLFALLLSALWSGASAARPFDVEDLVNLKRLSEVQISPDGSMAVYALRETDMEGNRGQTRLWALGLINPEAQPRPLTARPTRISQTVDVPRTLRLRPAAAQALRAAWIEAKHDDVMLTAQDFASELIEEMLKIRKRRESRAAS